MLKLSPEKQEYFYKCIVEIDPETERIVVEMIRNRYMDGLIDGMYEATDLRKGR